jgi:hypothetical protein
LSVRVFWGVEVLAQPTAKTAMPLRRIILVTGFEFIEILPHSAHRRADEMKNFNWQAEFTGAFRFPSLDYR